MLVTAASRLPILRDSGYTAGAHMFFPAGIPLVALIAPIVYNAQEEKKREKTRRS